MRKGQVSFEFLMVTGVALFILAASTLFMFDYSRTSEEKSAIAQAAQIGYKLVGEARDVYIFGDGSFVTVTASFPDRVTALYVVENNTLVVQVNTRRGIIAVPVFSDIDINGTKRVSPYRVDVNGTGKVIHSGRSQFRVESKGSFVEIRQIA